MKSSSRPEQAFDALDNKENEFHEKYPPFNHPFSRAKPCYHCQRKSPTQSNVFPNFNSSNALDDEITRIIDEQLNESNQPPQKDPSIRELHLMFQELSVEPNSGSSMNHIEKLCQLSLDPIVIPNLLLKDKDSISLNFIKLLMAYNKLLKLVHEKNHQINIVNFNRKLIMERLATFHVQCQHYEDYYSTSSEYPTSNQQESKYRDDLDEEFDETSVEGTHS